MLNRNIKKVSLKARQLTNEGWTCTWLLDIITDHVTAKLSISWEIKMISGETDKKLSHSDNLNF